MAQAYSQFNPNSPCIPSVLSPVLSCEQDLDQTVKVLVPQWGWHTAMIRCDPSWPGDLNDIVSMKTVGNLTWNDLKKAWKTWKQREPLPAWTSFATLRTSEAAQGHRSIWICQALRPSLHEPLWATISQDSIVRFVILTPTFIYTGFLCRVPHIALQRGKVDAVDILCTLTAAVHFWLELCSRCEVGWLNVSDVQWNSYGVASLEDPWVLESMRHLTFGQFLDTLRGSQSVKYATKTSDYDRRLLRISEKEELVVNEHDLKPKFGSAAFPHCALSAQVMARSELL
jgi:hypothetical protein